MNSHRRGLQAIATILLTVALTTSTAGAAGAASAEPYKPSPVQTERVLKGRPVTPRPAAPDPEAVRPARSRVTWPKPGKAEVDLASPAALAASAVRAGSLPVRIGRAAAAKAAGAPRVTVEVLGRDAARRAGLLVRLDRTDVAPADAPLTVEVDYSGFRAAFGGDWASRLRLVRLPECALTTPGKPACAGTPLRDTNNIATGRISATVAVPAGPAALLAVEAGESGPTGDYTATELSPSAEWDAGGSSGDFTWSYGMRTPPVGPAPAVGLGYSSGSVDGRTASTNNQASWVGEGFSFWPGSVERSYKSCDEDKGDGANNSGTTYDLCWIDEHVSLSLSGHSSELVHDTASGQWHTRSDDGTRIQKVSGEAKRANGDKENEYWLVTTTDGTRYYFGLNRLDSWSANGPETNSVWTVPVFHNHPADVACHKPKFADSWCQRAYRWNLDHVVDPEGNTMTYYYKKEQNYYGRNATASLGTEYTRGGYLEHVDYGQRDGAEFTSPAAAQVWFGVGERCEPGGAITCKDPAKLTKDTAANWVDVPFDRNCNAGATCTNQLSATFWSRKRLETVTTKVLTGSAYRDVDRWDLTYKYPPTGDVTTRALWLDSIRHTGLVGGTADLPTVNFDGVELANRIDSDEGRPPLYKRRMLTIHNETGGDLFIEYEKPQCQPGPHPAPDKNTLRCFPQRWTPKNEPEVEDWFHKTVVKRVSLYDLVAKSVAEMTEYTYLDGAAWHWDETDLVKDTKKTWAQWRGYGHVKTRHGDPLQQDPLTETESWYYRGMDGDHLPSGTRDAKAGRPETGLVDDHWRLAGVLRESITRNGPGGAEVSGSVNDMWLKGPTASQTRSDKRVFQAYLAGIAKTRTRTALADGTTRTTEVRNTVNDEGIITQVADLAGPGNADDQCTTTTYARDARTWMLTYPSRVVSTALPCGTEPTVKEDVISDVRTYYDGGTLGAAPSRARITKIENIASLVDGKATYRLVASTIKHDSLGRPLETTDGTGGVIKTAYEPANALPTRSVVTTNALGESETTELEPAWGEPTAKVDANKKLTSIAYDPLGRTSKVWLPGRSKDAGQTPNREFLYRFDNNKKKPVTTETRALMADGSQLATFLLYDGQLRNRQNQSPTRDGNRVLTDTIYDSLGRVARSNGAHVAEGVPGNDLVEIPNEKQPAQTRNTYDGAGRIARTAFAVNGTELWHTTNTFGGDRTTASAPRGGTATTKIFDARGRTTEQRQYHGNEPTGAYDTTRYTTTRRGELESVTDSAGNTWSYEYDVAGHQTRRSDPDAGVTTMTYDDAGRLRSVTDGRSRTITHDYDLLGRQIALREGDATGPKFAEWEYDTLAQGKLASSVRHTDKGDYKYTVNEYDDAYRVTKSTLSVPRSGPSDEQLAGDYQFGATYDLAGNLSTTAYPAMGPLKKETVRYTYDSMGKPTTLQSGLSTYVTGALYTPFGEPLRYTLDAGGKSVFLQRSYEEGTRRVTGLRTERSTAPNIVANVTIGYDEAGNVQQIADKPDDAAAAETQCFDYDYLQRLTEAWTPAGECTSEARSVDALAGPAPYWISYTVDPLGNRTSQTRHATGGKNTESTYTYPVKGAAQPHTVASVATTGPGGPRTDTYVYDKAGNTTVRNVGGKTQEYDWDVSGSVTAVREGGDTTSYSYNADGERIMRSDKNSTTLYLPGAEIEQTKTGGITARRYYSFGGSTVAVRTSSGLTWLSSDHHGTNEITIAEPDQAVARRRSTPFGEERGSPVPWVDQRGFVGGVKDASTDLVHLGARDYDASIGRFTSVDPLIDHNDPQQMEGYAYGNNSPVTLSDPDGQIPCDGADDCKKYRDYYKDHPKPPSGGGGGGGGGGGHGSGDGDSSRGQQHRNPDRRVLPKIVYIDVPCSGGRTGPCVVQVALVPTVPCQGVKTFVGPCWIDSKGHLTDAKGQVSEDWTGSLGDDGSIIVTSRKPNCQVRDGIRPSFTNPTAPVKWDDEPKGVIAICVGAGGMGGFFGTGIEGCLAMDNDGFGTIHGTSKTGSPIAPAVGLGLDIGLQYSPNARSIEDLGGRDYTIAGDVGPAQLSFATNGDFAPGKRVDVYGIGGGPGVHLGNPVEVGISDSTVNRIGWWDHLFDHPGVG